MMDTTSKLIQESLLKEIIKTYYGDNKPLWWCFKYDFEKKTALTSRTLLSQFQSKPDDGVLPKYGFICLDNEEVVNVLDLVKAYDRDIKIQKIIE